MFGLTLGTVPYGGIIIDTTVVTPVNPYCHDESPYSKSTSPYSDGSSPYSKLPRVCDNDC